MSRRPQVSRALLAVLMLGAVRAMAADILAQLVAPTATVYSYVDASGQSFFALDDFILAAPQRLAAIAWTGTGDGTPLNFVITITTSLADGLKPAFNFKAPFVPPLWRSGNVAVTPTASGALYDYRYVLPAPLALQSGTRYWINIEANNPEAPQLQWSIARGTQAANSNAYFWYVTPVNGGNGGAGDNWGACTGLFCGSGGALAISLQAADAPPGAQP